MKCKKCGCELSPGSQFCNQCGTKCEESIEQKPLGQQNLSIGKTIGILILLGVVAYFMMPSKTKFDDNPTASKQTVQQVKKEPPPYTLEDAMKDLAWYENRLSEYVKMKAMDYSTAMKAAGELNIMWNEIQEVYNKKLSEDQVKTAYLKLQKNLPKAQKNIYPKIRKAWVKGVTADLARENVRISCRNASCNEINLKSIKYLNISAVQAEMDSFDSDFSKIRMRKIWFQDTFGSGTCVTRQDVSDGALE